MIGEIFLKESSKLVFSVITDRLKGTSGQLKISLKELELALNQHIKNVKNWSSEVSFKDLKTAKKTEKIFVELNTYVYPRSIKINPNEKIDTLPLTEIFLENNHHIVLLGQPGAGKTTSMKFICRRIFFDPDFHPNKLNYPILIRLRDFNNIKQSENSIGLVLEYVYHLLGIQLEGISDEGESKIKVKERVVLSVLEELGCLIIIDGFDELVNNTNKSILIGELKKLANYLEKSKIILTSRTADYGYHFENISVYELCPLSKKQIRIFAQKWLGSDKSASEFSKAIANSPFADTTIRPLTVAHLCAIYERVGQIPEKPKTVYRKIVRLLLEEWDEQRNVKRVSRYASFDVDRKFDFLIRLAFQLTYSSSGSIFSQEDMRKIYLNICEDYDHESSDSKKVIAEIESHTGLFLESGYEMYEFAHKSIQEYLGAEYIVRLPNIPNSKRLIYTFPNELAIAISISSNPSEYFVELIKLLVSYSHSFDFFRVFLNRLLLEKPEFNKSLPLAFSVLTLYSIYLENAVLKSSVQLSLFLNDDLILEFEHLIYQVFKRNSREIILKFYQKETTSNYDKQNSLVLLKKRELEDRKVNPLFHSELPLKLHCRESFLDGKA